MCGITADEIRTHGRMGCAACYHTFEALVIQAAEELHDVLPTPPPAPTPRPVLPWPTRRGESHPADAPTAPSAPPTDARRRSGSRRKRL